MGARIPPKIKPFPGLVAAWRARQRSSGTSLKPGYFDPPKRGARHKPPRRSPRRKSKPRRSRARGYGKVKGKPYKVGPRGGAYWSGGRKPRYDPKRRSYRKKAKSKLEGIFEKVEKKFLPLADLVGFLGSLIMGIKTGHDTYVRHYGEAAWSDYWHTIVGGKISTGAERIPEIAHLWTTIAGWNPLNYLRYKLFGALEGKESAWSMPFIVSAATVILCKLGLVELALSFVTSKAKRIVRPIEKIAGGALIASTIGALALPGSPLPDTPSSSNPGTSHRSVGAPASMYG